MAIRFGRDPEQFNRNLSYIMQYLSQMNLMKKREAGQKSLLERQITGREQYLEKQTEGWKGLETQRHAGSMKEIEHEAFVKMANNPRIQYLNGVIQLHRQLDKPLPAGIEEEFDSTSMEVMTAAYKLSTGQQPKGEDLLALGKISESFQKQIFKGVGDISKQREQAILVEAPKIEQQKAATAQRQEVLGVRKDELAESKRQFNIKTAAEKDKPGKGKSSDALKTWFDQLGKYEDALIDQIKNLTETDIGGENDEAIANNRAKLKNINAERETALSSVYGETGLPAIEKPVAPPTAEEKLRGTMEKVLPWQGEAPAAEPEIPPEITAFLKLYPDETYARAMSAYNAWLAEEK